jgi:hypothetical protein
MQKIRSFITARPMLSIALALAVGGVIALAFPAVAKWLKPVASKVPGSSA